MSTTDETLTYRYIPESHGVTFTFTTQNSNRWIGTRDLMTCVGVYLPISQNRCFIAHINAQSGTNFAKPGLGWSHNLSETEMKSIRQQVRSKLRAHATSEGWTADDVRDCGRGMIMCPAITDMPGHAGQACIDGIEDFLGDLTTVEVYEGDLNLQGFAVEHGKGNVKTILRVRDEEGKDVWDKDPPGFKGETEESARLEWKIIAEVS